MPAKAATGRKGRAVPARARDRSAGEERTAASRAGSAPGAARGGPAPAPDKPASYPEEEGPLITTVRIPGYLAENIRRWLFENPGHTQHSMIFAGLAKLGIEVRDEDLEPRRRPRSSRGRR